MEWDKDELDALNECENLNKVGNEFCKMVLELRYQYLKLAKGKILERIGGNNNA